MEGVEGSRWALMGCCGPSRPPPMMPHHERRLLVVLRRWRRAAVGVDWVVDAVGGVEGGRDGALGRFQGQGTALDPARRDRSVKGMKECWLSMSSEG